MEYNGLRNVSLSESRSHRIDLSYRVVFNRVMLQTLGNHFTGSTNNLCWLPYFSSRGQSEDVGTAVLKESSSTTRTGGTELCNYSNKESSFGDLATRHLVPTATVAIGTVIPSGM